MKKTITLMFALILTLTLSAKTINVSVGQSIQAALNQAAAGDVVKVAEGTYYESVTVPKGVTLEGASINTILSGITAATQGQRAILNNGTVRWITVEFFDTEEDGAIFNNAGVVEYCIVRGCRAKEAAIWNEEVTEGGQIQEGLIRNCLMHNNEPSRDSWPNSGGFYNPHGKVINCTSSRNYGQYSGWHAESCVINSVSWGNAQEAGFSDKNTFISSGATGSAKNASDNGFEYSFLSLGKENTGTKGPRFVDPTPFTGAPTTDAERQAVSMADFRIQKGSFLINRGKSTDDQPKKDLYGVDRPKADTMDIGAYEYDPNAAFVKPTGVRLLADTLRLAATQQGMLIKEILPHNASNKDCRWISSDVCVNVENGIVTGVQEGTAVVTVQTIIGRYTATAVVVVGPKPDPYVCPEVRRADSLYHIEDYTIPSYIQMWVAKEAARKDSSQAILDSLQHCIDRLQVKEQPYCVVATINGDPKTHMGFAWFTNGGVTQGEVQLVAKANATEADFEFEAITVAATPETTKDLRYAVSTSGILKATGMPVTQKYAYVSHKALAEDLLPGTQYCYRVGFDGHWSDIRTFHTEDAQQGDFSFLLMSDSHIENKKYVEQAQMCSFTAAKNASDARFLCFPGDFVETGSNGNSEWEWERWFEQSMKPTISLMPLVPTDGNHDDSPNLNYDYHFNTNHEFYEGSTVKPQFKGITYSFVYGDVLFMVYSKQDYWRGPYNEDEEWSDYISNDIGTWFREQVALHPNTKWRVAVVHYNVFSGSGHQSDEMTPMFRATMLPIIKECEIDVMLQGHDHCYEIMGPVDCDTRTPILSAISNRESVKVDTEKNRTGLKGGVYDVSDGPLFFIGATCGEKRYSPNSKISMENTYPKHKVENYYDLFTGMFGQPGKPTYTRIDVTNEALTFHSFTTSSDSVATEFNTFKVTRQKPHTGQPSSINEVAESLSDQSNKVFMWDGQLYVRKDNSIYTILGQPIELSKIEQ